MAIIYTYPVKTNPVGDDLILISDSADTNNTKQVKVSTLPSSGGGSVSSVGFSLNSLAAFAVTGDNPVTGSGTITLGTTGGSTGQYLDYQGNWSTPASTTYNVMGSGNSYAAGLVLAGNATHNNNFLRKDGTWAVPGGVSTFTNTNGTFISAGTENSTATGAVTMGTIDLSATGTPSSTTFLRGDNTWATPTGGGISFSGSTANGIATYSSATTANVSSNLTIDNTNKKLSIGSTYSIQDLSGAFNIGSLSSTQAQENIAFYINGSEKVKIDEDGRLVSSAGSAANPNLKLGAGNDGIYGTSNTVQIVTNGTSKISVADGNTADIQMNDLVEFGYGLRFGATGETLSSYEEGTWTPVMFQSSSPSVTATGYYIKIGKKVTAFFTLVCTAGGSAEISNARISGLPFNAYSANGYKAGVSIAENTANAASMKYIAGAPGGATTLDLKIFPSSGTDYQYAQGRWPNSQGNFTVSGSYTYHAQS